MTFLHGVEVIQINKGVRPIRAVRASVIGLVGTAPKGPINVPTLITGSRAEGITQFGSSVGTIPDALDGIFDQAGAMVVVINVLDPAVHKKAIAAKNYTFDTTTEKLTVDEKYVLSPVVKTTDDVTTYVLDTDYTFDSDTGVFTRLTTGAIAASGTVKINYDVPDETAVSNSDIIGAIDATTGKYTGLKALLSAESDVGVQPKILIAPSFTGVVVKTGDVVTGVPVTTEMVSIADSLRAVIVADGPNGNDANAMEYRGLFGSKRVYVIDPWVSVLDETGAVVAESASARVAGVIARNDADAGYYTSPSNQIINGIIGTTRAIDFTLGDANSRANLLNENEVATIIQKDGYRLWGNRTCSGDAKWAFLSHVRLDDIIMESILRAHMWAVDKNITKTYAADVSDGVNAFLAQLQGVGAISGGNCWYDEDLNTAATMENGQVYFNVDYGRYGVAENVKFRAAVNSDYTIDRLTA